MVNVPREHGAILARVHDVREVVGIVVGSLVERVAVGEVGENPKIGRPGYGSSSARHTSHVGFLGWRAPRPVTKLIDSGALRLGPGQVRRIAVLLLASEPPCLEQRGHHADPWVTCPPNPSRHVDSVTR